VRLGAVGFGVIGCGKSRQARQGWQGSVRRRPATLGLARQARQRVVWLGGARRGLVRCVAVWCVEARQAWLRAVCEIRQAWCGSGLGGRGLVVLGFGAVAPGTAGTVRYGSVLARYGRPRRGESWQVRQRRVRFGEARRSSAGSVRCGTHGSGRARYGVLRQGRHGSASSWRRSGPVRF
jgi:hypothetical protein